MIGATSRLTPSHQLRIGVANVGTPRLDESENRADAALESLHVLGGGLTG
jgi:hypothetical protein